MNRSLTRMFRLPASDLVAEVSQFVLERDRRKAAAGFSSIAFTDYCAGAIGKCIFRAWTVV